MSEEREGSQKHQAAYAQHNGTITHSRLREAVRKTHRGSSLSEEIINMRTSSLSAPPVLKILNVTALIPWNRGADLTVGR